MSGQWNLCSEKRGPAERIIGKLIFVTDMEKLIITAAICGAEVTKEQNPAVPYTVEETDGCTCDCPKCWTLLLIRHGKALDFHMSIHALDPRWPENGENTGFVEVNPPGLNVESM